MIATICAGVSGPSDMCSKTFEAASVQSGFYHSVIRVEDKVKNVVESKAKNTIGNGPYSFLAYGAIAAKIGTGGTGSLNMKGGSVCDKITLIGSKKQGSLGFGWNF